ncbi:MAG: glycosyltransferase family 4 protein [Polaribacter sp.]|uniref:glycosyltransferase family 4 protein n=1 Tax=Polaribacter sp. TaxID=1920175 RepID=UPI003BB1FBD0
MKILFIHTRYQLKGGEDVVFDLEKNALSDIHQVETLYFRNEKGVFGALEFLTSIWNFKKNSIVKKKIESFSPDIIHLHNWHFATGPLIIRGIKKKKIPLVITLHNFRLICPSATLFHNKELFTKSLNQNFPWRAVQNKVYRNSYLLTFWLASIVWFHKKIGTWKMVDAFICPSPFMVELFNSSILNIDKKRFTVKPNFSEEFKKAEPLKPKKHFLYVGRLSEEKGINVLLQAFKNTKDILKIVGTGPLKKLVEESCLEYKNIIYLGFLSKEEIAIQMQQANALIFPSIWHEPFGLAIIEAFSNNCAIIASNIGAPKALVKNGKNGFHFDSNNPNSLLNALQSWNCLSDSKKEEFRLNAYNSYLENYSIESHKIFINHFYKSILKH